MFNLLALGAVYRAHFALDAANEAHAEAQTIAQAMQHPRLLEWSAIEQCADAAVAGEWHAAHGHALAALAVRSYRRVYVGFTRWLETAALVRAGDTVRAAEDLRQASAVEMAYPRNRLQCLRAQAVLHDARSEGTAAVACLHQAGALAVELGLLYDRWHIAIALAERERASGDMAQARTQRVEAAALMRTLVEHIAAPELRSRFLDAAPVRHIMLGFTDLPVKHIAGLLGYSDVFHLSKTFKRVTGVAPQVFRTQREN